MSVFLSDFIEVPNNDISHEAKITFFGDEDLLKFY